MCWTYSPKTNIPQSRSALATSAKSTITMPISFYAYNGSVSRTATGEGMRWQRLNMLVSDAD